MEFKNAITPSKLALALPVLGMFIVYMWQPISDYLITGGYNENVVLLLENEALKIDDTKQMLVLHIKPQNRGNVPVDITSNKKHGKFTVEVRRMDNLQEANWQEPEKMPLVSSTDLLRHHKTGYTIESNAFYDEVEAMALKNGFYWVSAKLTFDDGDYIDESIVVSITNEKQ